MPKYLNAPIQILWWTQDEIVPFIVCLVLGMFFDKFFIFLGIGILYMFLYSQYSKRFPAGVLQSIAYMVGFKNLKGLPVYYDKDFKE